MKDDSEERGIRIGVIGYSYVGRFAIVPNNLLFNLVQSEIKETELKIKQIEKKLPLLNDRVISRKERRANSRN